MPLTTKAASELAKFVFGGEDIHFGPQLKIALYKSSPSATGGGTEVSGGGYQRVAVDRNGSQWANDDPNDLSYTFNQQVIQFPAATADWGTVTHVGIWANDGASDYLFMYGPLSQSKEVKNGDGGPEFALSALQLYLDGR